MNATRLAPRVIENAGPLTKYYQVAVELRNAIHQGIYRPGDQLPTVNELSAHYNVSRLTIRDAFKMLQKEGLIVSGRGSGTFVRDMPPVVRLATDRLQRRHREAGKAAYSVDAEQSGFERVVHVLDVAVITVDDELALKIDQPDWVGIDVVRRSRCYLLNGQSAQWAVSYIPFDFAEGTQILEHDTGAGGIYARLEDAGYLIGRFEELVQARMPRTDELEKIAISASQPVLRTVRKAFAADAEEVVLEVCDSVMSGDSYQLLYEFPAV